MLVFFSHPRGSTMINGQRIYGYFERYLPVVVPWALYKEHKDRLVQAPYDKKILGMLFPGNEFPNVSFTYHEMRFLDWEQMCSLCKACGITTNRSNSSRRRKLRKFFKENC